MGAKANHSKVELMVIFDDYFDRVGVVKNFYELERLGLTGHDFCGCFGTDLLPSLKMFIAENPTYHIVSSLGEGRVVNRLCENARSYLIANGDSEPLLELNFLLDPQWPLIYEDGMAAAIAELNNIKNGHDT
ncbi:MAG: hypothetical protein FJ146_18585 [Deltaproteobacteria bacterium]|nr:hypothetical protein [Deltaproteobacteria bacterium]